MLLSRFYVFLSVAKARSQYKTIPIVDINNATILIVPRTKDFEQSQGKSPPILRKFAAKQSVLGKVRNYKLARRQLLAA